MKKRNMKVFSLLLAASMTVPQLADYSQLSGLTVVHAAVNEEVSEKAVTEVWRHFTSGATNDNGQKPAVLKNTNKDAIDPAGGDIKELESALVAQGFQIIWPQNSVDLLPSKKCIFRSKTARW